MSTQVHNNDVYFKKLVTFPFNRQTLQFKVSQSLFSSFDIDHGTKFLLKTFVNFDLKKYKSILDIGCGYGVIGITLKALDRTKEIHSIDRDSLAVEYTLQNAALNNIKDIEAYGSLGYDNVDQKFGLIVSNIPAKAGEPIITSLLLDAQYFLTAGGMVAVVVVKELEESVEKILTDPNVTISLKENRKGHTVFHYQFTKEISTKYIDAFERGVYNRKEVQLPNYQYSIKTVYGLPEFDTLNYRTQLLLKELRRNSFKQIKHALVLNPNQGLIPVFLWKKFSFEKVSLVDRDILALVNTKRNLLFNGCSKDQIEVFHSVEISNIKEKTDLVIGLLQDGEPKEALFKMLDQLPGYILDNGSLFLSGTSTTITRATEHIKSHKLFSIKDRNKWKGYSVLHLQK